jgi:peptidoglycan/LPS O-acetylase OafA/YrhL
MHEQSSRRYDLDWLRTIAIWLLVPFHSANVYAPHRWYLDSDTTSPILQYGLIDSLNPWHMPLLFLIAGAATGLTVHRQSNQAYRNARWHRLGIPLLVGWLVIVPLGQYFAALHHGRFTGSVWQFLPGYFASIPRTDGAGFTGEFAIAHLWFLAALWLYSLVLLPWFRFCHRPSGQQTLHNLATFFARPGLILLIPCGTVLLLLPPLWIAGRALFYYAFIYAVGFLLITEPQFEMIVHQYRSIALILAGCCLGLPLGLYASGIAAPNSLILDFLLYVCGSWYILLALWGYGRQYLSRSSSILTYWNEAGLPFYILHQPAMIGLGYGLLSLHLGILTGFALLSLGTFTLSLLIYEIAIRPIPLMRFLFGLKRVQR